MRKVIFTLLITIICQICTAPVISSELRMSRIWSLRDYVKQRHHEREFLRLIDDLGYRESLNNWVSVNSIGCFGEWQFSESTLNFLGFENITLKEFEANPKIFPREIQLEALKGLINANLGYLRNYEHFIGDTIKDVVVTKSGMIAASHLGGAGSLMKFLNSKGRINKQDVYGTSIYDYLKTFSDYELE